VESRPYTLHDLVGHGRDRGGFDSEYFASSFQGEMVSGWRGRLRPPSRSRATPDGDRLSGVGLRPWTRAALRSGEHLRLPAPALPFFEAAVQVERAARFLAKSRPGASADFAWFGPGGVEQAARTMPRSCRRRAAKGIVRPSSGVPEAGRSTVNRPTFGRRNRQSAPASTSTHFGLRRPRPGPPVSRAVGCGGPSVCGGGRHVGRLLRPRGRLGHGGRESRAPSPGARPPSRTVIVGRDVTVDWNLARTAQAGSIPGIAWNRRRPYGDVRQAGPGRR